MICVHATVPIVLRRCAYGTPVIILRKVREQRSEQLLVS